MKPTWETADGSIRLYCADCMDVLPTLEGVDAVVTDPPYGVGLGSTAGTGRGHGLKLDGYCSYEDTYENFVAAIVPRLNASLGASKRGAIFTGPHIHEQLKPTTIGGIYCSAACGRHEWGFKNFLPVLLYGIAPDLHLGAKEPTVIASNATAQSNGHPCPKPTEWMLWAVRLASRSGDLVLDPFMGSGTTGVACVRTGRKFIGIEKEEKYFAIAVNRIEAELNRNVLFEKPPEVIQRSLLEKESA